MTYFEILFVPALETIFKGNLKASTYGTNVILDRARIWITTQIQHHHLSKKSFLISLFEMQHNQRKHATPWEQQNKAADSSLQ